MASWKFERVILNDFKIRIGMRVTVHTFFRETDSLGIAGIRVQVSEEIRAHCLQ